LVLALIRKSGEIFTVKGLCFGEFLFKTVETSLFLLELFLLEGYSYLILIRKLPLALKHFHLLASEVRVSLLETTLYKLSEIDGSLLNSIEGFFELLLLLELFFQNLSFPLKLSPLLLEQVLVLSLL
jgi:hypothetical protein